MRVLLIANVFPPIVGGSAIVYENICRHLTSDVLVLAPSRRHTDGQPTAGWQEYDASVPFAVERIDLLRAPIRPAPKTILHAVGRRIAEDYPLKRRVLHKALSMVDRFRPEVVCLGDLHALSWLGQDLKRRRGLPVVQFIHGEEITNTCSSRAQQAQAAAALRELDAMIAVSSFTRSKLLELGLTPERVHLIRNGVDSSRFYPGEKNAKLIERHNLQGKKVLLTVARMEERKGHDRVIEAMPEILKQVPNAVYLIVGTGPRIDLLKQMAVERNLTNSVLFTGEAAREEIPDYYRLCDVFLMPNRTLPNGDTEGFGLVFLEAGACAKPVIGGLAGGVPDAVLDNETGFLVNGENRESIVQAAVRLLSNADLAQGFSAAGLRHARENDWKYKAQSFLSVCQTAREAYSASQ